MLKIISAFYDNLDVTDILNSKIENNTLNIQVSNDIFTDPNYGVVKELNVKYEYNNQIKQIIKMENDFLKLPLEIKAPLNLKVSFVCTTYRRFRCVERIIAQYHAQTYQNKELIIFNTDIEHPFELGFEDETIKIINNNTDYNTGEPYKNRGQICRDAVTHASGDYFMLADDDDIYLPWHLQQAVEGIEELDKDAWKPMESFFSTPGRVIKCMNTLEASVIVKMNRIREIGFRSDATGYEGLSWYTKLRDERQLNEYNKNYIPSYCFNWSDPGDMSGHKQSGDIDNPNNFENHKLASTDYASRPLMKLSKEELNEWYEKYYKWIKDNLDKVNIEYYNRYAKKFVDIN